MAADALAALGWPVRTPESAGRYSPLEFLALELQRQGAPLAEWDTRLGLTLDEQRLAVAYDVSFRLRPYQVLPGGDWSTWFFCAGRGAGKTFGGSAATQSEAEADPEMRGLLVGPTYGHIKQHMLYGPSGLMRMAPPWARPQWKEQDHLLKWPNGAEALCVPAVDADKFRGGGYSWEWLDEVVAWKRDPVEVWQETRRVRRHVTRRMKRMGLSARTAITTSPAPTPIFRELLNPANEERLSISRATTLDNAENLDRSYVRQARRLMHTTVGAREFGGLLAFDLDPALYRSVDWNKTRVRNWKEIPARPSKALFDKLVVSVDPATGEKKGADMHGIVVEGIREEEDGLLHVYVLQDLSLRAPEPSAWAKAAVKAYHEWKDTAPEKQAWVFAETNTGGSMVKSTVRQVDGTVKVKGRRAMNSKAERAAPVSSLCEAGLVHMVGRHRALEEQLARFTGQPGGHARDDRADAFAWPIYLYVVPKRQNRGAVARVEELEEDEE
ncbi:terminase large subunit domain-containing protein [Hyalangium versicolor]|uniref:terminase large subunit domain-containing protein n=1 Tax=Hyalangium versicolor TaxID=2861190 RepID=UPI001CCE3A9D|nr:terminase family protein [Hyalangium versicolor]